MNMKIKDPYYSYEDRVNGMISIAFKHTTRQSRQSEGNKKEHKSESLPKIQKGVNTKNKSLRFKITGSIARKGEKLNYIKCLLNGVKTSRSEIIQMFETSTIMISNLSEEYETIFVGKDRIDFVNYDPKCSYSIFKDGVVIEKGLSVDDVASYLGITVKSAYHKSSINKADKNGYLIVNERSYK